MGFRCILVGTDGSETADKAVQAAAALARQLGAELHVVSAYRPTGPYMSGTIGVVYSAEAMDEPLVEVSQGVVDTATSTWGEGLKVHSHVLPGSAADAIVETARNVGADLVVVGNKGMRGAGRVLGSVPNSVAHRAGCSVLVVKTS